MLVDLERLRALSSEFSARMDTLMREIYALAGGEFNIGSPPQLRTVLFDRLGLSKRGVRRGKTGFSTDVDVLTRLAQEHPLPALLANQEWAKRLHRMDAGVPYGIWIGMASALVVVGSVCLIETLAAGMLLRRHGQVRAMIAPYAELVTAAVRSDNVERFCAILCGKCWRRRTWSSSGSIRRQGERPSA